MPNILNSYPPTKAWPGQLIPIILAGGSGSRLAPLSTPDNPKQFLRLFNGKSLLQQTIERAQSISDIVPIIVTTAALSERVRNILVEMKLEHATVICEPSPKGTAAAVLLVTRLLGLVGDSVVANSSFLVMPSDHHFLAARPFYDRIGAMYASLSSHSDEIGLFGVRPDTDCLEKTSGYGFAVPFQGRNGPTPVVSNFIEKPSKTLANTLRAAGSLWNSGIFIVSKTVLADAQSKHHKLDAVLNSILEFESISNVITLVRGTAVRAAWDELEILSLDNMLFPQRSEGGPARCRSAVVADITDSGWSDIGTWEKLFQRIGELDPRDDGNITYGNTHLKNCENCLVFNEGPETLRVSDLSNSIIISTIANGVSVYSRPVPNEVEPEPVQGAKTAPATDIHRTALPSGSTLKGSEQRPWGSFDIISQGPRFKTKHLHVNPQSALSHQVHQHRKEQWTVVVGSATVTVSDREMLLQEGDSVTISAGTWHRLENRGKLPLLVIEVQTGPYLEEDDIERRPS